MPMSVATNDAAVELVTCESRIVAKPADVERSIRYAPPGSSPRDGAQTIEYVAPALIDAGANVIDVCAGAVQSRVVKLASADATPLGSHGLCATTRQKYVVDAASPGTFCVVAVSPDASSGGDCVVPKKRSKLVALLLAVHVRSTFVATLVAAFAGDDVATCNCPGVQATVVVNERIAVDDVFVGSHPACATTNQK